LGMMDGISTDDQPRFFMRRINRIFSENGDVS